MRWPGPMVGALVLVSAGLAAAQFGIVSVDGPIFFNPALSPAASGFTSREVFNFGSAAGGPAPARPAFTANTDAGYPLALLLYVNPDCSVSCRQDNATHTGMACPGVSWNTPTSPTCRQIWTGDYALTDITDANAWVASNVTISPSTLFNGDVSASVFGYSTNKESANAMLLSAFDTGANNGLYLRNQTGSIAAVWFETTAFPGASAGSATITNGFELVTMHRAGHVRNVNINANAENADVATALGTISVVSPMAIGIGRNSLSAGQAMGGQFVWAAIYSSAQTLAQSLSVASSAVGAPAGITTLPGTGGTLCFDQVDAGQVECIADGLPYIDARGIRTFSGERTTSVAASDPLDLTTLTAVQSPGIVTNVKQGPFFEVLHSAEMDRIIDTDAAHFSGVRTTGNSWVRGPDAYTACWYASVGDGGTSNKVRITVEATAATFTADGGSEVDCDFANLTDTPRLLSCTGTVATWDGGVVIRAGAYVGNAAGDTGSVTLGHVRVNYGVTCEPAELSNVAIGDGYLQWDVSGWHSDSSGGEHEVVWSPLATAGATSSTNSPSADWQETGSAIYLHDAYDNAGTPNHLVTFIHGYTIPGHELFRFASAINNASTDLTADNINLVVGSSYATAARWLPTSGGNCALSAIEDVCSGSVSSCVASTPIATGSGACPDQPLNVKVSQRYDNTVPTDAWILSVRHKTP